MRECPFCGFNEGWTKDFEDGFVIECKVCGATGPKSNTREGAQRKWDGHLKSVDNPSLEEEAMGGVSAPMSTLNNVPGVGNATPGIASTNNMGSGDKWDNSKGPYTQDKKKKKKKKRVYHKRKKVNEQNINPYDKIGSMMAKKMGVSLAFKKPKDESKSHVEQIPVEKIPHKYRHKVSSYTDYANLVGEKKKQKRVNR